MASLYKRGNGYYHLSFFGADRTPSRKQVATGTTTKRKSASPLYAVPPWSAVAEAA